jgi:hypothetical protein
VHDEITPNPKKVDYFTFSDKIGMKNIFIFPNFYFYFFSYKASLKDE